MKLLSFIFISIFILFSCVFTDNKCKDGEIYNYETRTCEKITPPPIDTIELPYYFFVIHMEPMHGPGNNLQRRQELYDNLLDIAIKAYNQNIKLTIMFSAQYSEIATQDDIDLLKQQGHEISSHHHAIDNNSWDGYTNFKTGYDNNLYLGDLDDFMGEIYKIDPSVKSGCMNDENYKGSLPDQIIYDTCSGYYNTYNLKGQKDLDIEPGKGVNEFIATAIVNNISRKWLAHTLLSHETTHEQVLELFKNTDKDIVFGLAAHTRVWELEYIDNLLDLLNERDPSGKKSKTVTQIIDENLLPTEEVNMEIISPSDIDECDLNKDGIVDPKEESICNGNNCDLNGDGIVDPKEEEICNSNKMF